jgi:hypothetical protein
VTISATIPTRSPATPGTPRPIQSGDRFFQPHGFGPAPEAGAGSWPKYIDDRIPHPARISVVRLSSGSERIAALIRANSGARQ